MVKISKESQLIEEISGLIDNSNISTQELEILSNAKNKLEHIFYSIAKLAVACKRKETIGKISSGKSAQGRESKRKQGKIMVAAFLCL